MRDHYLIHYVAGGRGSYQVGETLLPLKAGDLFLIFPRTLVSYQADWNDPWTYYWVGFNGADAGRLIDLAGFDPGRLVMQIGTDADGLRDGLVQIYNARGNQPANDVEMTGRLYLFLSRLIAFSGQNQAEHPPQREYIDQAIRFIEYNYAQAIGVTDIADYIGLCRSQLYRIFIREMGVSPNAFLTKYRINKACSLLRSHNLSIAEVAASVGFSDPFYFSRVFKQQKGVSPSLFVQER